MSYAPEYLDEYDENVPAEVKKDMLVQVNIVHKNLAFAAQFATTAFNIMFKQYQNLQRSQKLILDRLIKLGATNDVDHLPTFFSSGLLSYCKYLI